MDPVSVCNAQHYNKIMGSLYDTSLTGKLSAEASKSVTAYTKNVYKGLNKYLRTGVLPTAVKTRKVLEDTLRGLEEAFAKASLSEDIVVYRGIGTAKHFNQLKASAKAGETVMLDGAYVSTSLNKDVAAGFSKLTKKRMLRVIVPKGSKAIPTGSLSLKAKEFEVLLDKNSSYLVREVTDDVITLEMVPAKATVKPVVVPKPVKAPKPKIPKTQPVKIDTGGALETDQFVKHPKGWFYIPKDPSVGIKPSGLSIKDFKTGKISEAAQDALQRKSLIKPLIVTEENALSFYSGNGYQPINKFLRDPSNPKLKLTLGQKRILEDLDIAIEKASLPDNLVVYRALGSEKRFKELVANAKPGETIMMDKAFISTTMDKKILKEIDYEGGGWSLRILLPKNSKALPMGKISGFTEEAEVLIHRNSKFVLREVNDKMVTLELVVPKAVVKPVVKPKPVKVPKPKKPDVAIAAQKPVVVDTEGALKTNEFVKHPKAGYVVPKTPVKPPKTSGVSVKDYTDYTDNLVDGAAHLYKTGLTKALSSAETRSLYRYTASDYRAINSALRTGKVPSGSNPVGAIVKDIDKAFEKASLGSPTTVYRGLGDPDLFAKLAKTLKVGQTAVVDKAYMSTTLVGKGSLFTSGGHRLKILLPKGSKAISLSSLSKSPKEFEMLLKRNSSFVVKEVTKHEITLEMVVAKV